MQEGEPSKCLEARHLRKRSYDARALYLVEGVLLVNFDEHEILVLFHDLADVESAPYR